MGENEIVVASPDELRAARLSCKRLLTLWNGLAGAEKRTRVGNRETLVGNLWSATERPPENRTQFGSAGTLEGPGTKSRWMTENSSVENFPNEAP